MYRLNIKKYVDTIFDGNINKFAKAIGVNYNPAKQLYSSETTRINFDVLTSLCNTFHCTPNDILINDDISSDKNTINYSIVDEKTKIEEFIHSIPHTINIDSISNTIDIETAEDKRMARIANDIVLSYLKKISELSDSNSKRKPNQLIDSSDAKK